MRPLTPDLQALAQAARKGGRLAMDTEFVGEGRYRTLLCLIQLAVSDGAGEERIELLDPLQEELDATPLARVLADPDVAVVVHAGRQDVALVKRYLGTEVRTVFDTQVAAGFVGMPAQASYDTLLTQVLGIRVAKSASFTRWDARPLSAEQLAYAREDVVHLLELASELEARLARLGRLQWAREECEPLQDADDERDLERVFARLPRARSLSDSSQMVARELVRWREQLAQRQDRPVQSVLSDAALVEIAKRKPTSTGRLEQIRGVNPGSLRARGQDLLEAVRRGRERPPLTIAPPERPPAPDPDDAPLIALAEALVRSRAREAELAYELLATKADLQAIVAAARDGAQADVRTLRGWRRELVGDELLELLDGKISLSARDGKLRVLP
ncbi:MAG TPA: HRDC domain-containing protein [Solirubrobacteraceae bacterium]|nr:HRDC domain-containing protein [Solirubrobacteraceae bacterium]